MKSVTFNYFAMLAKEFLDFEEDFGIPEDVAPLEHFVRTQTKPTKKQINKLIEVYDNQKLKVKPKGGQTPVDIRLAVEAMGDTLGVEAPQINNRGKGRPNTSIPVNLIGLKEIILKHGFRLRDLADLAGVYPSLISASVRGPTHMTPARLENILEAAQMLFTGNSAALKDLRKLEKELDQ